MCQVCQLSKSLSLPTPLEAGGGSWGGVRGVSVRYRVDERGEGQSMHVIAGQMCRSAEGAKVEFIRVVEAYL